LVKRGVAGQCEAKQDTARFSLVMGFCNNMALFLTAAVTNRFVNMLAALGTASAVIGLMMPYGSIHSSVTSKPSPFAGLGKSAFLFRKGDGFTMAGGVNRKARRLLSPGPGAPAISFQSFFIGLAVLGDALCSAARHC
jgi:hypothetical protein